MESFDSKFFVFTVNDITINIQYNLNLGEKKILQLINACVSHEMRNPINAIIGMNLKLKDLTVSLFYKLKQ
jgi:signal transduction histidine kinase